MPVAFLNVISKFGHYVPVDETVLQEKEELSGQLNALRCVQCKNINFSGRKLQGGDDVVCVNCLIGLLKDICTSPSFSGDIVEFKNLTQYSITECKLLRSLRVICSIENCDNSRHSLGAIDAHMVWDHGDREIRQLVLSPEECVDNSFPASAGGSSIEYSELPPDIDLTSYSDFEVGSDDEVV
ncbi:hypothetical protein [Endozoicomonas sp.]|uniref:hypothetical protein n=1 Tax=Endozoicomonas sp. TaxID=1892382 RepID=UPI00288596E3|nr:hypothetical protein [Endozoicomonas sp.]